MLMKYGQKFQNISTMQVSSDPTHFSTLKEQKTQRMFKGNSKF